MVKRLQFNGSLPWWKRLLLALMLLGMLALAFVFLAFFVAFAAVLLIVATAWVAWRRWRLRHLATPTEANAQNRADIRVWYREVHHDGDNDPTSHS